MAAIVRLIDEAAPVLEWRVSDSNDDGRMTRAYALGLKLRVLLFAASPLFNSDQPYLAGQASDEKLTWYGNYDPQRWKAAEEAGREFMESLAENGQYDLVQAAANTEEEYRKAFRDAYFTRGIVRFYCRSVRIIKTIMPAISVMRQMLMPPNNVRRWLMRIYFR